MPVDFDRSAIEERWNRATENVGSLRAQYDSAQDVPALLDRIAELEKLAEDYTRVMTERDNARSDAERAQLALAIGGGGADPNGYYAGTPGARVRDLLAAEKERDGLRAEVEAMRPAVEAAKAFRAADAAYMADVGPVWSDAAAALNTVLEELLAATDAYEKAQTEALASPQSDEQAETVPESTDGAQEGAQGAAQPAGLDAAIEAGRKAVESPRIPRDLDGLARAAVRAAAPHIRRAALIEAENLPVASSGGYIDEQQRRIEEHGAEMLRRAIRERAEREVGS